MIEKALWANAKGLEDLMDELGRRKDLMDELGRGKLRIVRTDEPDTMDLARIGEALADAFTDVPDPGAFCLKKGCGGELTDEAKRMTAFDQHVYAPPPCGKRMDGDRLVELLDRLGFEIVRQDGR